MHVTGITIYPVKALRGLTLGRATVEPWGLAGDRRYLVVDDSGRFVTQRECPALARLDAEPTSDGLILREAGSEPLRVSAPVPEGVSIPVSVWRDTVSARRVGAEADRWLTAALARPCRLVFMADPARDRPVDPAFGQGGDHVSFADGFPLLLTSEASLDDLNGRLAEPVPMERFRPNLVIAGAPAWAEDGWTRISVGPVTFDVVKPCARCIVTTTDQRTGERDAMIEPICTLQGFRRDATGQVLFGQNLVPRGTGPIGLGEAVTVLTGSGWSG